MMLVFIVILTEFQVINWFGWGVAGAVHGHAMNIMQKYSNGFIDVLVVHVFFVDLNARAMSFIWSNMQ